MSATWRSGNRLRLLVNGEEFFPAVFDAIRAAQREVLIETFILFEDKVGHELRDVLVDAGRRGVEVHLLVDGFGASDLTPAYIEALSTAGVHFRIFGPQRRFLGMRLNLLRRMHRKITVVDGTIAFVGGINFSADHLGDFGPEAKQDYAVEVEGPVVEDIHRFARAAIDPERGRWFRRRAHPAATPQVPAVGGADAIFVPRDNHDHPNDIERHYRVALRSARRRVLIANAYFFPGYRLLREMRRAARRGVEVHLILQGEADMAIVKTAAGLLYEHLLRGGVHVHEYCKRPLHGKVAVVDDEWSTIGSSNLDPLSLALNLEANLSIRDREFNRVLAENLECLMRHDCRKIEASDVTAPRLWVTVRSFFVFHVLRHFPLWATWLPAHAPRLFTVAPKSVAAGSSRDADPRRGGDADHASQAENRHAA
ncbi:MAG TPA: cardiolipin synthase ClsB [Burkholderiaceae bacterium]|nr:cardiolipin synthase ClsB [Burkholderiaceae bacterium]